MHQSKKGNQWYFGMKLHIGADSQSGLVHSASVTSGNVHDSHELPNLLHGEETRLYGDSAYRGEKQRERIDRKTHPPAACSRPSRDASLACVGLARGGFGLAWAGLWAFGVCAIGVMTDVARVCPVQASEAALRAARGRL